MMLWLVSLFMLLSACGNDGNDTVLTGFSGVLIFGIAVWLVFRYVSKKGKNP